MRAKYCIQIRQKDTEIELSVVEEGGGVGCLDPTIPRIGETLNINTKNLERSLDGQYVVTDVINNLKSEYFQAPNAWERRFESEAPIVIVKKKRRFGLF